MTTPFSTSSQVEKCVMGVTLMESMKCYFSYTLLLCGFPEITLEGTPEDYQSILDRLKKLKEMVPDFEVPYFLK